MSVVPFVSTVFAMPLIGYGTWQSKGGDLAEGVQEALNAGYRHFDCAAVYENEEVVGNVFDSYLKNGKIKREDLFIVSKLPPTGMRSESVEKYLNRTLRDLKLDYLDLYLVHTPFGFVAGENYHPLDDNGFIRIDPSTDHIAIWKEMEKAVESGKVKAIGLSNFNTKQIQRILDNSKIKPSNLQVEIHLYHQQKELKHFCDANNISVTAYSPLGTKGSQKLFNDNGVQKEFPDLFNDPAVVELAQKYNKTSPQILLRHLTQNGIVAIPKSTNPKHIKANIDIFDFSLTGEELEKLNSLDQGDAGRIIDFKFFKGIEKHPEYPF